MARKAPFFYLFSLLFLLLPHYSEQLQPSQIQALLRIKQLFNLPEEISSRWSENADFCNTEPSKVLTISCYGESIAQIHVNGNNWFENLLDDFSTVSLFSNLSYFPDLKVLSLVSLGLKGPLPPEIGKLTSLEILNVSSNYFNGSIPQEVSSLKNLQTLILDYNMFTGEVPEWIDSFPALSVLSLKNNSFTGQLPNSLTNLTNLRTLVVSANNLSGQVPFLQNLTNLQVLDSSDNNLGPEFPSIPTKLTSLVLSKNKFHSAIFENLTSCHQLKILDVSSNELVGPFSQSLFSLPLLSHLDISGNKLTGKLLHNISCNGFLDFIDLTDNRLTGELPDCLKQDSKTRVVLYSGNCLSGSYHQQQNPYSFCHNEALAVSISPRKEAEKRPNEKTVVASSMVGGIVGGVVILSLAFLVFKRKYDNHQQGSEVSKTKSIVEKDTYTLQMLKNARYISETTKLRALGIPTYRTFVYDQLKEATSNFSTSNLISENETRGQVYKGWLVDGTVVAIRTFKIKKRHSIQSFTPQLEMISKLRHSHLVSVIGHCFECHKDDSSVSRIFLIFEYVPNGNLRKYISEGNSRQRFTWTQRIKAAIEVARGIQFFHTGMVPEVYSNHLKITDVLMDHGLQAKIGKYNLPLLDDAGVSLGNRSRYDDKDAVHSFGVILLEIIVGRAIADENDVCISKDILSVSLSVDEKARRSIVDPAVHKECSDQSLKTTIELCVRCLSNEPSERPSVEDVIWNLQFAAQVQDSWQEYPKSSTDSPLSLT